MVLLILKYQILWAILKIIYFTINDQNKLKILKIHKNKKPINKVKRMATELCINDFDEYSSTINRGPCIVKFTATWCIPCKRIESGYRELLNNKITLIEVDIDNSSEIINQEKVRTVPLFLFYNEGKLLPELTVKGCKNELLHQNITTFLSRII